MTITDLLPVAGDSIVPLVQLGSFGVLAALIWHIVRVQIPAQDQRADARQAAFLSAIDKAHADAAVERERKDAECREERERSLAAFTEQLSHARANYRQEAAMQRDHDEREGERLASALTQLQASELRRERGGRGGAGGIG